MFSFRKKKKEENNEHQQSNIEFTGSKLTLQISTNKNVKVTIDWPECQTEAEVAETAKDFANLICHFINKDMLQYVVPVIISHGNNTNNVMLSQTILLLIDKFLKDKLDKNSPIITPRNAFKVRG